MRELTALERIEKQIADDKELQHLVKRFWKSIPAATWRNCGSNPVYLGETVEGFYRSLHNVRFCGPLEIETLKAMNLFERVIRVRWAQKAVKTKRRTTAKRNQLELAL